MPDVIHGDGGVPRGIYIMNDFGYEILLTLVAIAGAIAILWRVAHWVFNC